MDLTLALGRPIGSMPEREFRRWQKYALRKGLPSRRLEFYLANIAMLIAHTMGGSTAPLSDFLFDAKHDDPAPATAADVKALQKAFDYRPRKRRKHA